MKKIKLAVTGCMGRMGQQLIKSISKDNSDYREGIPKEFLHD